MKLLQGDCIEQLRRLPEDVRADICLCDPPYSSGGLHAGDRKANTTAKYTDNDFNGAAKLPPFSGDNMDQRSFTEFMRRVCVELRQKTREGDPGPLRRLAEPSSDDGCDPDGRMGVERCLRMGQGHLQEPAGTLQERLRVHRVGQQWRPADRLGEGEGHESPAGSLSHPDRPRKAAEAPDGEARGADREASGHCTCRRTRDRLLHGVRHDRRGQREHRQGLHRDRALPGDLPDSAGEDRRGTARRCGRAA